MKFEIEKLPGKMELPGHGQQQSISSGNVESPYAIYKNRLEIFRNLFFTEMNFGRKLCIFCSEF